MYEAELEAPLPTEKFYTERRAPQSGGDFMSTMADFQGLQGVSAKGSG